MKKKAGNTQMQANKLRQECSAAWGGAGKKDPAVAFRATEAPQEPEPDSHSEWKQWPLTAEEEAILCKVRGA